MKNPRKLSSPRSVLTRAAFGSLVTAGAGLLSLASSVRAADDIWVFSGDPTTPTATTATSGGGTGNWDDGPVNYWSLGVKPTTGNNAVINNGGTVNVTANETATDVLLGTIAGGTGFYNQTAGTITLSAGWCRLGTVVGTSAATGGGGSYTISGGGLAYTGSGQNLNVGEDAFSAASLTINGTGSVSGTFSVFNIGRDVNSLGFVTVGTGGTINMNSTVAGTIGIGNAGTGTLNITGGAVNIQPTAGANPFAIGRASTGNGTVNLSSGTLNIGTAAVIQEMWVGNAPGASATAPNGTFTQTGGTTNVTSWLAVGRATTGGGNGLFNLSGGTVNAAINGGNVSLSGVNAAAIGVTNITGGTLNTPNNIYVTEGGLGTLSVSGTGVVNEFGGTGLRLNTTGTANTVATGTVNLGDGNTPGGLLSVNNVNTTTTAAGQGARSVFNFNGGTLQAKFNNGTFFGTGITSNVRNLGATIDSNQTVIGITGPLTHSAIAGDNATDGGLTKIGLGSLILSGANTYTGNTTITTGSVDAQTTGSVPGLNTAGRVNVGAAGALVVGVGYSAGQSVGDIDTARASNTFATGGSIGLDIAAAAGPATYGTNLTPAVTTDFYKLGAGQLFLVGTNTYTGITYLQGGLLSPNIGSLGTGGFTFNGGGLQFAAGDTTNFSNRAVVFNGPATIDTNGNNVTFANTITGIGGGSLTKQGLGTLTLTGGFNFLPARAFAATSVANNLGNLFVQGGAVTLTGAAEVVNTGGNYASIGVNAGNQGTLNVLNGASFTTTGDFNVGDNGGTTAATLDGGIVNLSGTGSAINTNQFFVGKGTSSTANFAYGVFNQSGGTSTVGGNQQIGAFGVGQVNLTGGTMNHTGGFLSVARQPLAFGVIDVNGATAVYTDTAAGTRSIIGEQGTATLNVRNGGVFNANSSTTNNNGGTLTSALAALTIGNTAGIAAAPVLGVVNLLPGGTINTQSIGSAGAATANTTSMLNLSGGTLKNTVATATFLQNLNFANVYGNVGGAAVNGAVIDTTAGNATITQALVAPAGQGVTSIAATGSGFSTTPIVQITGGGGVGATGIANVDANGNLTGVTITNPGINYTAAPTVTITGPFGTVATTSTATIGNNVSGGLTKLGINTLTLTAANTYTGPTTISAGTLALTGAGSIAASPLITTATGATFSLGAATTFGQTQTLTGAGTIQGAANALTIAGTVSPGNTPNAGDINTLTIATTGTLTLSGTAILQIDIASAANKDLISAPGAQLTLSGTLALRGTIAPNTMYTLFTGLTSEAGNPATVTGVPANYVPTYSFAGGNYSVTFAVPEPSTWAMGVFGLGMAALWLRRRRVA